MASAEEPSPGRVTSSVRQVIDTAITERNATSLPACPWRSITVFVRIEKGSCHFAACRAHDQPEPASEPGGVGGDAVSALSHSR